MKIDSEKQLGRPRPLPLPEGLRIPVLPPLKPGEDPLAIFLYPGAKVVGDVESPIYTDAEWDRFCEKSAAQVNDRS